MGLQDAVLRSKCPVDKLRSYLDCASNRKDNTPCCKSMGVLDKSRSICRPLCNPQGDDWPDTEDDARRLFPCLGQFTPVMRCHWASVEK
uniref:Domain of unknown function DB domain-containing protein n=1 Tax=Romanomermis culicivorax TaxID=13658 RepID=A0A915KMG3_ROMCU